jgi:acetyl esterase/lipase
MAAVLWSLTPVLSGLVPPTQGPPRLPAMRSVFLDRQWPSTFSSHLARGMALAVTEAAEVRGLRAGLRAGATLARLAVSELLWFPLKMLPFAVRTMRYRKDHASFISTPSLEVYGEHDSSGPLVVYLHGGSWGQGAPWQYALLARRLLEGGASRVAIAQYRLFPDGDVEDMLDDVSAALRWAREQQRRHAEEHAEAPRLRVVLAAQSAGAHICALHLARTSFRANDDAAVADGRNAGDDGAVWVPDRFVALSGVFDIASHFSHERTRLVHWLSPMWLAMIGRRTANGEPTRFRPLADAARKAEAGAALREAFREFDLDGDGTITASELGRVLERAGEQVSRDEVAEMVVRADTDGDGVINFDEFVKVRTALDGTLADMEQVALRSGGGLVRSPWRANELVAWAAASPTRLLTIRRAGTARTPLGAWPPTVVLHTTDDTTVPVSSSREFVAALDGARVGPSAGAVRYAEYDEGGHGEIMVSLMGCAPTAELPAVARDFVSACCTADGMDEATGTAR